MQNFEHISLAGTISDVTTIIDKVIRNVHAKSHDDWQFRGHHWGNDEHGPIFVADIIVTETNAINICKYNLDKYTKTNNFSASFKKISHNNLDAIPRPERKVLVTV